MAFDIDQLQNPDGWFDCELDGEPIRIGWGKPDPYELIDLNTEAFDLNQKLSDYRERTKDLTDEERAKVKLEVKSDEYMPTLQFICEHVLEVDGLESGGEAVAWEDLDLKTRMVVLRKLHPGAAFKLLNDITTSAKLGGDRKNG